MTTVANFTVHEPIEASGRADSVREALEQRMPSLGEQLEFTQYLRSLHASLVRVLSMPADVMRSNPYFYDDAPTSHSASIEARAPDGVRYMQQTRSRLVDMMLESAEAMSEAAMAQANSGWTLLMLTWCVVGQLSLAIERVRRTPVRRIDAASLERNELLTTSGGIADVPQMSMMELRRAIDVLRDRASMLDTIDGAIVRYMLALEHRAAQFAHRTAADDRDYNCRVWMRKDATVNHAYMASMCTLDGGAHASLD